MHEKLVHLIIVHKGLDHFDHVHPDVATKGQLSAEVTFPVGGDYFLFADYQPQGGTAALGKSQLSAVGNTPPAPQLQPNQSPVVDVDGVRAKVTTNFKAEESTITFQLMSPDDKPLSDLQPYLGAMGHLVILSADGGQYVHSHPLEHSKVAAVGTVAFAAHFTVPGIYKMWGQFQRDSRVFTIPFVIDFGTVKGQTTSHH
ncbi:MAG: hypothetical protein SFV81_29155 [Pirellulaceae bacterium]|nr:hypothetical protein [Pirellulaceae bacterium]